MMTINFFQKKTSSIVSEQHLTPRTITETEYYQLKCTISNVSHNELVTSGILRGVYSEARFRNELKNGSGGFHVCFGRTSFVSHFNWKQIINNPHTFMFLEHISPSSFPMILFSKMSAPLTPYIIISLPITITLWVMLKRAYICTTPISYNELQFSKTYGNCSQEEILLLCDPKLIIVSEKSQM